MNPYLLAFLIGMIISTSSFSFGKGKNEVHSNFPNAREINLSSSDITSSQFKIFPKDTKNIPAFDLKLFLEDKDQLERFIIANISILEINSSLEVTSLLKKGSEGLFFESFFKTTPLLSEFIYNSLKEPASIAKFISLFFQFNKLIIFSLVLISTFIGSHFLGEYKFNFTPLSLQRITYSFFRFGMVNSLRIGSFTFLFYDHLKPIGIIYTNSVLALAHQYPILHTIIINLK